MEVLSNLLQLQPDLILQPDLRDQILSKLTFEQFFSEIYKFPDIYEKLSSDQQYWREYLQINYPDFNVIITPNTNWFYETIKAAFSKTEYYISGFSRVYTPFSRYFQELYFNKGTNPIDKYFFFTFNKLHFLHIKQRFATVDAEYLLFTNGDLLEMKDGEEKILFQNVKKFLSLELADTYRLVLTDSGELIRFRKSLHPQNEKMILPFKVKDIQPSSTNYGVVTSMIDIEDNMYLVDLYSASNYDYNNDSAIRNPVLRKIPLLSYSFVLQSLIYHKSHVAYVTIDNLLFYKKYQNNLETDSIQIKTYNDVLVKNCWIYEDETRKMYSKKMLIFYQDIDDNIYRYDLTSQRNYKYQLPENEKVIQFVFKKIGIKMPVLLIFVTKSGKFYFGIYNEDQISTDIIEINPKNRKDFPRGTSFLDEGGSYSSIFKVLKENDHIFIPYAIYLYYLQNKMIISDKIKEQDIIFTIANSPYLFQTKIE